MTKLKELKEYIQKEIPEIIEDFEEQEQITDQVGNCVSQVVRPTGRINTYERPITLEDVLRVIRNKDSFKNDMNLYNVRISIINSPKIDFIFNDSMGRMLNWELNKPLDQQSEKTIEFLHELLTKK